MNTTIEKKPYRAGKREYNNEYIRNKYHNDEKFADRHKAKSRIYILNKMKIENPERYEKCIAKMKRFKQEYLNFLFEYGFEI